MKDKIVNMLRAAKLPDWEIVGLKRELAEFAKLVEQDVEIKYAHLANEKLTEMYEAGVKAEREACAKECDDYIVKWRRAGFRGDLTTATDLSKAIRARGTEA